MPLPESPEPGVVALLCRPADRQKVSTVRHFGHISLVTGDTSPSTLRRCCTCAANGRPRAAWRVSGPMHACNASSAQLTHICKAPTYHLACMQEARAGQARQQPAPQQPAAVEIPNTAPKLLHRFYQGKT